jgi:hypothetical protein
MTEELNNQELENQVEQDEQQQVEQVEAPIEQPSVAPKDNAAWASMRKENKALRDKLKQDELLVKQMAQIAEEVRSLRKPDESQAAETVPDRELEPIAYQIYLTEQIKKDMKRIAEENANLKKEQEELAKQRRLQQEMEDAKKYVEQAEDYYAKKVDTSFVQKKQAFIDDIAEDLMLGNPLLDEDEILDMAKQYYFHTLAQVEGKYRESGSDNSVLEAINYIALRGGKKIGSTKPFANPAPTSNFNNYVPRNPLANKLGAINKIQDNSSKLANKQSVGNKKDEDFSFNGFL